MNKRQKKKKIGYWAFVKFPHDSGIYAVCQSCGFTYPCSTLDTSEGWKVTIDTPYNFCPDCGRRMKLWNGQHTYDKNGNLIK